MANITLFDTQRGDVTLTAAMLTQIRNGGLTLNLFSEKGDQKFDASLANAVVAGTASLKVAHSAHGHRGVNSTVLSNLT
jgi:hypothetical protein